MNSQPTRRGPTTPSGIRLALNADTTPLLVADTLMFKSLDERAREAAAAGFDAVNVDSTEKGLTPRKVREILEKYQLEAASGFFHGAFYSSRAEDEICERASRQAKFSQAIGQTQLFVSTLVAPAERHALAGRIKPGEPVSLDEGQYLRVARLLERIARMWLSYGILMCFHPHVATYIEAPHEIDRLMELTDPQLVRLGPDTGHLLVGGGDPLSIIDNYFERLEALHIKDVDAAVLERVRREGLNYREACAAGIWTELGSGCIDFPALFKLLRDRHWSGWVIVETDHTRYDTALESSQVSRRYLKQAMGI